MQKVSTATIVWGVITITFGTLLLIGICGSVPILGIISLVGGFVCLVGTFISFVIHEGKKERAIIKHNERVLRDRQIAENRKAAIVAANKAAEEERRKREREEWSRHHGVMTFPVKGVTYKNDDGSSRQKHLAAVKDALDIGETVDIEFIEFVYDDGPAYRIEIDGIGIGNVPAEDVSRFAEILPHIEKANLSVEVFTPDDDNRKIYRADVFVTYAK